MILSTFFKQFVENVCYQYSNYVEKYVEKWKNLIKLSREFIILN